MARVAPNVPAETDLLCEACGYTLNGLPPDGRCPECGKPLTESVDAKRFPTPWEQPAVHRLRGFLSTTAGMIFTPTRFYRTLATRLAIEPARRFAQWHWLIAAVCFGLTAAIHLRSLDVLRFANGQMFPNWLSISIALGFILITYLALAGVTRLAARLTNIEATYRGLRLPTPVVLRGMYYHAAHYLPVALGALLTVALYRYLRETRQPNGAWDIKYLYTLAGEVVLAAGYLFHTYWIGMRNMMYANR